MAFFTRMRLSFLNTGQFTMETVLVSAAALAAGEQEREDSYTRNMADLVKSAEETDNNYRPKNTRDNEQSKQVETADWRQPVC